MGPLLTQCTCTVLTFISTLDKLSATQDLAEMPYTFWVDTGVENDWYPHFSKQEYINQWQSIEALNLNSLISTIQRQWRLKSWSIFFLPLSMVFGFSIISLSNLFSYFSSAYYWLAPSIQKRDYIYGCCNGLNGQHL